MFSDDDDFSDDLLEVDSSSNSMPAPAGNAEEEFRELIKQQERIQKEMKRVDELAKQVKFALELQKAMLDCYSNRVSSLPIETQLELRYLSSGSFLIVFAIRNNTVSELVDWTITASVVPSTFAERSTNVGSFSQSIALETLLPEQEFSSELFFPQPQLQLPIVVRLSLKRKFIIGDDAKCVIVELDSEYLSLRDLLHAVKTLPLSDNDEDRSTIMGNFTLRLPCCLVDLLSGCPDDNDPANVLRILLPEHRFRTVPTGTSSTDALLVLDSSHKHKVGITVSKDRSWFTVCVSLRDASLRDRLRQALQLYVIHLSSRILKRPSSNSISVVGCRTVDELFDSAVSSFST